MAKCESLVGPRPSLLTLPYPHRKDFFPPVFRAPLKWGYQAVYLGLVLTYGTEPSVNLTSEACLLCELVTRRLPWGRWGQLSGLVGLLLTCFLVSRRAVKHWPVCIIFLQWLSPSGNFYIYDQIGWLTPYSWLASIWYLLTSFFMDSRVYENLVESQISLFSNERGGTGRNMIYLKYSTVFYHILLWYNTHVYIICMLYISLYLHVDICRHVDNKVFNPNHLSMYSNILIYRYL